MNKEKSVLPLHVRSLPQYLLLQDRNTKKRFAIHAVNGEVKTVRVSEGPDDPAGDTDPSASLAEGMLEAIKAE